MRRPLRWVGILAGLVAPLALAHVFLIDRGVHFKDHDVDFGLPPTRYARYYGNIMLEGPIWRPGTTYIAHHWSEDEEELRNRESKALKLLKNGWAFEQRGNLAEATAVYRSMLRQGVGDAAFLRERIELSKDLSGHFAQGLPEFLRATQPLNKHRSPLPESAAPILRPYLAYHRALHTEDRKAQADMVTAAAVAAPHSRWADACLITAARSLLEERDDPPTAADMARARPVLERLLLRYPHSRFAPSARGWLARIDYLKGRTAEAFEGYREELRHAAGFDRSNALLSLAFCELRLGRRPDATATLLRRYSEAPLSVRDTYLGDFRRQLWQFTARDARKFWKLLEAEPHLLGEYVDYRGDFTEPTPDLIALALRIQPARGVEGSHVLARLAESALRQRRLDIAARTASRAIRRPIRPDDDALARFVLGSCARRRGNLRAARDHYARLVRRHPGSFLADGARENLAILNERLGDLGAAIDLYDDLGYEQDMAYLADARMTPEQLRDYLSRPGARHRELFTYTLGLRYLRQGRWQAAESVLRRLSGKSRTYLGKPIGWFADEVDPNEVQDPLVTCRDLSHLDRAVKRARSREKKAAAMLAMANYYYGHRELLLYSPRLWNGTRAYAISFSWNDRIATAADRRALARHHDEHECLAHTLRICQEIVRRYPNTRTAPHAAYRGACAAERLANLAPYWRWTNHRRDLLGQSVRLMRLAGESDEAKLRTRARKYAGVFSDLRDDARQAFADEQVPERRWQPQHPWVNPETK